MLACVIVSLVAFAPASAQRIPPPQDLPSERPREIPIPGEQAPSPLDVSPAPEPLDAPVVHVPLRIHVSKIRLEGNTALDEAELREIVAPYLDRPLVSADLEAMRSALTSAYVDRGYITSGVVLPDQDFADGLLVLRAIEGRLARVRVRGNRHLRDGYVSGRVTAGLGTPLRLDRLEERLQLLQQDRAIRRVTAELRPGDRFGESILWLEIEEERRLAASTSFSNDRSPSIGSYNVRLGADVLDVTGFGDVLSASGRVSRGLLDLRTGWEAPVTSRDTRVGLRAMLARSKVVELPFSRLDIESTFVSVGLGASHPIYRSVNSELRIGVIMEWRRAYNTVFGHGFSFSPGADRGESIVAPLRFVQEWTQRTPSQVFAARSIVSVGLPVMGSTDVAGAEANGKFVSWIVQGQWARRFEALAHTELILRADLQLANDPLLPSEQFSLGGHSSVRGYRENQLVTDQGIDASFEIRVPVWRRPDGRSIVQLATFVDVGHGWDKAIREANRTEDLASVGLGLRTTPADWLFGEIYWGHRLVGVPNPEQDLQDHGVYFKVTASSW